MNAAPKATLRAPEPDLDSFLLTSSVDKPPRNYRHPDRPDDFILPRQTIGECTMGWNEVAAAMTLPLDPKIWIRESSGSGLLPYCSTPTT